MNISGCTPYVKEIVENGASKTIKKIEKETKNIVSELHVNNDGSYVYKKHTNLNGNPIIYKTEFDGTNRSEFVVQKARNGKLKTTMTRQLVKLNSFIEWCDMFFDKQGEIVKEVIKVKGVAAPKIQTEIPIKPSQRMKKTSTF